MPIINEFSSLVATLYEAAADSQHWSRFMAQFYTAMNSTRGALTAQAEEPGLTKVILEGYTEAETRDYSEYYFKHDRVLAAGLEVVKRSSQWIGPLDEIVPYKELEATEIYNDYYRKLDMYYASCVMVGATGPYSALGLAAWRPKQDGPFSPEQLHLVELLTPHLKQAFQSPCEAQRATGGGASVPRRAHRDRRRRARAAGGWSNPGSLPTGRGFAQPQGRPASARRKARRSERRKRQHASIADRPCWSYQRHRPGWAERQEHTGNANLPSRHRMTSVSNPLLFKYRGVISVCAVMEVILKAQRRKSAPHF